MFPMISKIDKTTRCVFDKIYLIVSSNVDQIEVARDTWISGKFANSRGFFFRHVMENGAFDDFVSLFVTFAIGIIDNSI